MKTTFALLAIGLLAAGPAFAHARLKGATPAAGATISAAPGSIMLEFSEGVVPKLSGIALADAAGKAVATGPAANGSGAASLAIPVTGTLAPGTYVVKWHAVSVDSHRTQGTFTFKLAP